MVTARKNHKVLTSPITTLPKKIIVAVRFLPVVGSWMSCVAANSQTDNL